ncbi:MAG: acyl carrier protein [Phycisphaerae bacterium]
MSRTRETAAICDEISRFLRANVLDEDVELTNESGLRELGVDSVGLVELLLFVERRFGVMMPDSAMTEENLHSVDTLALWVSAFASHAGT